MTPTIQNESGRRLPDQDKVRTKLCRRRFPEWIASQQNATSIRKLLRMFYAQYKS